MELTKKEVTVKMLEPAYGKQLKNIITKDIYDGTVYLGKEDSEDNYVEVDKIEGEK